MVIRLGCGATIFNPRTGRNVGDDATPKKNSGDEARELLAQARSRIAALGMVIPTSTTVVKSNDGATPAAIRAHPEYKDAHDRGFAMVARSRGFQDGCTAATQKLDQASPEPRAPLGVTNANGKR